MLKVTFDINNDGVSLFTREYLLYEDLKESLDRYRGLTGNRYRITTVVDTNKLTWRGRKRL